MAKKAQTAFELYHLDISEVKTRRSKAWFDEKIKLMNPRRVRPNSILLRDGGSQLTGNLIPGKLYAYYYMAKGRDDLPFFDTFPMVFPFAKNGDTFHGLNMHYLDYQMRFALFKELLKISSATNLNESSKMKFTWEMVKGVSKLAPAQACVKQYRFDHVRSPFLEIEPNDWATALLMPLARWSGSTDAAVWQESKKISRAW